jgi:hypothetical protein
VYAPAVLSGPTVSVPMDASVVPFHPSEGAPPVAAQDVAAVEAHVRRTEPPVCTVFGTAVNRLMLGNGGGALVTFKVTELGVLAPPGPLHVRIYV